MRAIDGDALIDKYGDWYTEEGTEEGYIGTIKGIVDSMPTIEPERKTGKWLPDNSPSGGFWVCSCCKFPSEAFAADKLYKYCPVCGCQMYEGGKDER